MKKIIPCLCMLVISIAGISATNTTFQTLDGVADTTSDSWAANILQTSDGGYVTVGYISNFGAGGDDISVLKLDANGDTVWLKIFGTSSDDDAAQIIQTLDGGYAIVGFTSSDEGGNAFLIKLDAGGNLIWSNIYGTGDASSDSWFSSAVQNPDSSYVMAGYISNYGAGGDDFYLLKTDASGTLIWTKTFGGGNDDDAYAITNSGDGGYVIAGGTSSFADTLGDVYLIKTDANGDTVWNWTYGSNLTDAADQANSVQRTSDGGYIMAGVTQSASQGEFALLIKTDSTGAMLWSKLYGTSTAASNASAAAVIQTTDGGYAFAGFISNFGAGNDDYYLVKTDASGNIAFTRTYGSTGDDMASGLTQTADGGYMISGWTDGFQYANPNGGEAYYVKTDTGGHTNSCNEFNTSTIINGDITFYAQRVPGNVSNGGVGGSGSYALSSGGTMISECSPTAIQQVTQPSIGVSVYPVPFSDEATVKITTQQDLHDCVFVMYDMMGREVNRMNVPAGLQFNIFSCSLEGGMYLYRIVDTNETLYNGKLMIAK